jgi:hypothetical protein
VESPVLSGFRERQRSFVEEGASRSLLFLDLTATERQDGNSRRTRQVDRLIRSDCRRNSAVMAEKNGPLLAEDQCGADFAP